MSRSSLKIDRDDRANFLREVRYKSAFDSLFSEVLAVSKILGVCELRFQHRLKEDDFAVMVETKRKTFGQHGSTFLSGIRKTVREMAKFRREHEELRSKKEPSSGEEGGRGRRRSGSTRLRISRLRKERRQGSR